ncbi:MAG: molybdenum cofactor guanylyltransferase [Planctomycetes bacterium]|nr:molybdenum cofactor guanylyltransferase [Planctomycetota bacterium]
MGADKAGLRLGGVTLLERAVGVLGPCVDELLLATGEAPRYADLGLPIVLDRAPDLGPLAGLEAALVAARGERVVALAVDMPGVTSELVARLCAEAERTEADALLLADGSGVEPLCAVYHVRVLPAVRAALDAGERRMTSLFDHPFAGGQAPRLALFSAAGAGATLAVRNVNTSEDFDRARELLPDEHRAHPEVRS